MKRAICIFVLLAMLTGTASAMQVADYPGYLSRMLEEFKYGYFEQALNIYDEIVKIWPKATDRKGNVDDFAQYCRARVAMDEYDFNQAINLFSSLTAGFPEGYDQPKAESLSIYCMGQRYLSFGMNDEALVCFLQCNGTLDAAQLISQLTQKQEDVIVKLTAPLTRNTSITLMWDDMGANDTYSITYMPKGTTVRSKTVKTSEKYVILDNLIPETDYTVYITPYKEGSIAGAAHSADFSTNTAESASGIMRLESLRMYCYDIHHKNQVNSVLKNTDRDYFLDQLKNGTLKGHYTVIDEGGDMQMPLGSMKIADDGFIIGAVFRAKTDSKNTYEVRIVLRPEGGGTYDLVRQLNFDRTRMNGLYIYLDDMLQEVYESSGGVWPYGIMFLDIYIDDSLLTRTQYKLAVKE